MNENKCEDPEQAAKQNRAVAVTMQVTKIIGMPHELYLTGRLTHTAQRNPNKSLRSP